MPISRATRIARVLFAIGLVYFIAATVLGWPIHWWDWLMLGAGGLMLASSRVSPRTAEYFMIGSAALMLVSVVGSVVSKFQ
jgi:hypothetical protein